MVYPYLKIVLQKSPEGLKYVGQILTNMRLKKEYAKPLSTVLDNLDLDAGSTSLTQALIDTISKISFGFLSKTNTCKKSKAGKIYLKLPLTIKSAKSKLNDLYRVWADNNFSVDDESHVMYILQRSVYRNELRKFLRDTEMKNIKKLHFAADSNEKEFWKLVKGQLSFSQMSAFQIDGAMCIDEDKIRDMWADHFEFLGTPPKAILMIQTFLIELRAASKTFLKFAYLTITVF